jgi:hypothetical protein
LEKIESIPSQFRKKIMDMQRKLREAIEVGIFHKSNGDLVPMIR